MSLGTLEIVSDFPMTRHRYLLDDLVALRDDVANQLAIAPSQEPIRVTLFERPGDLAALLRTRFPELGERRAVFVESDSQLAVYAAWNDRVAEDLRHEVSHGYLHAAIAGLPLWLDEGLAEYFELPRGEQGRHQAHLDQLGALWSAQRWHPDLKRLEELTSTAQLSQADYAESWAWVHWLLNGHDRPTGEPLRPLLLGYLAELRANPQVGRLSDRLPGTAADQSAALVEHLESLGGSSWPGAVLPDEMRSPAEHSPRQHSPWQP